jgi:sec-independent protein translocase protein TatA
MNMTHFAFIQNLNTPEIVMIGAVVLLFFGAKRMPGLFQSLGKSVREFKKATSGIEADIRTAMDVDVEAEAAKRKRVAAAAVSVAEAPVTPAVATPAVATVAADTVAVTTATAAAATDVA